MVLGEWWCCRSGCAGSMFVLEFVSGSGGVVMMRYASAGSGMMMLEVW